jgi:hypothetical protein
MARNGCCRTTLAAGRDAPYNTIKPLSSCLSVQVSLHVMMQVGQTGGPEAELSWISQRRAQH